MAQPKRMSALRIQMHFHRHPGLLQGNVINQHLSDTVHVVILRLNQKRRQCLARHPDMRIQRNRFILFLRQMSWIKSDRKIRAAAFFVSRIYPTTVSSMTAKYIPLF